MAQPQDLLAPVRAVLSSPDKWTQHDYAKDKDGRGRLPHSAVACAWCLMGAIQKAYPARDQAAERLLVQDALYARINRKVMGISGWNDRAGRTFEEVQALLAEPVLDPRT